jgi:hypothetical protein
MKKSATVTLTIVAAMGLAARTQSRRDPCEAATFNEHACQQAIQAGGYCWNGRWVRLKYHYPFPYYYDLYQELISQGGVVTATPVGSCGPRPTHFAGAHGAARAGFGSHGACHSAGA